MTMGEGGAVYTNDPLLSRLILSYRDWGRDCICPSGHDNFCGHRYDGQYGELPKGYDHKYVYSHLGYNLKITDLQAAIGCEQLKKLPSFTKRRIANWNRLHRALEGAQDLLILPEPAENSEPSWFGFLITLRDGLDREKVVRYIEDHIPDLIQSGTAGPIVSRETSAAQTGSWRDPSGWASIPE